MKLAIRHDGHGHIVGLVAYPTDAPVPQLAAGPGERVFETDAPERFAAMSRVEMAQALQALPATYRVQDGRLVRHAKAD